jgi:hypothetical protein
MRYTSDIYDVIPQEKKDPAIRLLLDCIPPELQAEIREAQPLGPYVWCKFYRLSLMAWKNLLVSRGFDARYFQVDPSEVLVLLIEEALNLN